MTNDMNYSEFNMDCDNKYIDAMVIIFGNSNAKSI